MCRSPFNFTDRVKGRKKEKKKKKNHGLAIRIILSQDTTNIIFKIFGNPTTIYEATSGLKVAREKNIFIF